MARMPTPKMPKAPPVPRSRPDDSALRPQRQPIATAKPWDIINITTRMRETPSKKGR